MWLAPGNGRIGKTTNTYLLHIPNWVLAWHLTLAALHASQALVMRGARGAGAGAAGIAGGPASVIVSMLAKLCWCPARQVEMHP